MKGFLRDRKSRQSSKDLRTEQLVVVCYEACFGIDDSSAHDLPIDAMTLAASCFSAGHLAKSDVVALSWKSQVPPG